MRSATGCMLHGMALIRLFYSFDEKKKGNFRWQQQRRRRSASNQIYSAERQRRVSRAHHRLYNRDREAAFAASHRIDRLRQTQAHNHFDVDFTFLFYFDNKSTTFNIILWESPHIHASHFSRFEFRTHTRPHTHTRSIFVWASKNRVGKDIINYYRIRLVFVWLCVSVSALWPIHSPVVPSLTLCCIRFVGHSCLIHTCTNPNGWEFSVAGL